MRVEIFVKTSETENTKERHYYRGEAKISIKDSVPPLSSNFTFHLSDPSTDKKQFLIRKGDKIILNLKSDIHGETDLHFSSEVEMMLIVLLGPGICNTLKQIHAERAGSEGAAEQAASLWGQLGVSFEIMAEHRYVHEVTGPEEESWVIELCG